MVDLVILNCLLRQAVIHLDAVHTLLAKGCVSAAQVHLRAILEELFFFKWLLKEKTEEKARHLYVWNLRQRRAEMRRSLASTDEAGKAAAVFSGQWSPALTDIQTPAIVAQANKDIQDIDADDGRAQHRESFVE